MMNLMAALGTIGGTLGSWRHPKSWGDTVMNFDHMVSSAKIAEAAKIDLLFVADHNSVPHLDNPMMLAVNSPADRPAVFEPSTMYSALSQHTTDIGLMSTAVTTYDEPYLLARRFASLDHLSKGRAAWNVVTGAFEEDALNFSRDRHMDRVQRYERSEEFVEVCKGLWDSWASDAFIEDRASGRYLNPERVHILNHVGKHFSVKGPLNVARMPQGYPVLFVAGQSEHGRQLAAKHADFAISIAGSIASSQEFYTDIKGRLAAHGREPDHLRVMPAAAIFVGSTQSEVDDLYAELQEGIPPTIGVAYLSKMVEADISSYPIDGPMPELSEETNAISTYRKEILRMARTNGFTVRQTYQAVVPSMGHMYFRGTAKTVADQMEEWYNAKACDGFVLQAPMYPVGLENIANLLIPELQRRGLFQTEYKKGTLREKLGLPIPKNPHFE